MVAAGSAAASDGHSSGGDAERVVSHCDESPDLMNHSRSHLIKIYMAATSLWSI